MSTVAMAGGERAGQRAWIALVVLALPTLLVSIDVFVMLLALPHLSADLGASATEQLWIMDSYGFLLSGFLITMGTVGDRIGRRRLLLIGAAGFGAASVMAAYSTSPAMLIAARALLGIAGATLAPSTLSLISNLFRDPRQRALAIGAWLVCFMGGAAVGPLVGGVLLEHLWWGSVFLLGVPAMALLLVLGPVLVPEYRDPGAGRLDPASVALSLAAILPIVYSLKELARGGPRAVPLAALAVGLAAGVVFVRRQRRLTDPLLDLRLLGDRAFSTALGGMLSATLLMGAIMLFLTQHLQLVQGMSPLRASLWMLPAIGANLVSFQAAPLLARRIRPARLIGGGLAISVCGLLLLTQVGTHSGPGTLVVGWSLIGLGAGPLVTLATALVVGSAPPNKAGSAAALNETAGEFGFALGIAVLGSLGTAVYRGRLTVGEVPAQTADAAREGLPGAVTAAAELPGAAGAALLDSAREAFTGGLHVVAALCALVLAMVAVLIVILLRHVPPIGGAAGTETPHADTASVGERATAGDDAVPDALSGGPGRAAP